MKLTLLLFFTTGLMSALSAQSWHIGIFGGAAAYNGDLTDKIFPKKVTNGAVGVTINYEMTDHFLLRGGITYSVVGGDDRYNEQVDLRLRNLSFESSILEFSLVGEYSLLSLYESRITPYAFAGIAVYTFDPYTYNFNNQKTFLQPLSTEGQGITGYGKKYSLTQVAIPIGGGLTFAASDKLRIGIEGGLRKLFTDYLDDVSTNYADINDLLLARGQNAVDISYRSDELGGPPTYPSKGSQRGSPKNTDYYYFTGIHATYQIGSGGGGMGTGSKKSRTGCPTNVY